MESILKTKIWLHVIIMSRTRFGVNLQSTVAWMSRDFWKQVQSLSDCNGTQNLAKWLSVHLRTTWLRVRILMLSHNKYKKIFRSTVGIILWSTEHYLFSILSKNVVCCHEQKKIILLKHLLGLVFSMFMKHCFLNFV